MGGQHLVLFRLKVWQASKSLSLSLSGREPLTDCLKDVDLIPPFNRMLLEVTFGKLYAWAVQNIRNILMDANAKFKELGEFKRTSWFTGGIELL